MRLVSATEAMEAVNSNSRVYLHGGAATPLTLLDAFMERVKVLSGVELVHLHTEASAPYTSADMAGHVRHNALFIGPNVRTAVANGRADYTPAFLSEIPRLFLPDGPLPLDVALLQVTSPDASGYCSLGVSVDCALAAAEAATTVVAQINPLSPRTRGARIHQSEITFAVESARPLPLVAEPSPTPEAAAIGRFVAALVEDGATLQMGIGSIPAAVLAELTGHRHLGVHTEMFTDALLPLIRAGVVDGTMKSRDVGVAVSAFVLGSAELYHFVNDNPAVELRPVSYTNDVDVVASQHRMVAINSALAVDLTGQVAADSLGHRFYSGIGGQVDFIRGAARAEGGVPIIALPSTAKNGAVSRIGVDLELGSGVVTTRGDVHWVVTEFGAVNLFGQTIRSRARKLIDIAHPKFRAELEAAAGALGYLGAQR